MTIDREGQYPAYDATFGMYHYTVKCCWCNWGDDSDKGSVGITQRLYNHMEKEHPIELLSWRYEEPKKVS